MPHDAWGASLPFVIDTYKTGSGTITESLYVWHRLSSVADCANDGTTANTASQLQIEFDPKDVVEDKIFFTALLVEDAYWTIKIGGHVLKDTSTLPEWTSRPQNGGGGLYHGSFPMSGVTGLVQVCLTRPENHSGFSLCVDAGTSKQYTRNGGFETSANYLLSYKGLFKY
jgi:hypothetical protein